MDVIINHRFYLYESHPHSTTTTPPSPPLHSSHASFPIIAVAVIGILATAFLLVSYYVFVIKCCLSWHRIDLLRRFSFSRRRRVEATLAAPESRGLDEATIRSIPVFGFRKREGKTWECAVCLNEFQEEEKLRIIPNCAHVFHIDCIDIWLQNNANCPLCRTTIALHVIDQIPGPSPSPQDSNPHCDEDYVVIELGLDRGCIGNPSLPRILENLSSDELLSISPSPRKNERNKGKRFSRVSSMGDECIDNRKKDEQFVVQPMRRSFSMDSAADNQLYLAVQEIIQGQVNTGVNLHEDCSSSSRVKRSFFSFGLRSAVQPVATEL